MACTGKSNGGLAPHLSLLKQPQQSAPVGPQHLSSGRPCSMHSLLGGQHVLLAQSGGAPLSMAQQSQHTRLDSSFRERGRESW